MEHVKEVAVVLGLLTLAAVPAYLLLPSVIDSLVSTLTAVVSSLLYLVGTFTLLILVLGVALVAEKAIRRWRGDEQLHPDPTSKRDVVGTGAISNPRNRDLIAESAKQGNRIDRGAERIIDGLEKLGVDKLVRRRRNKGRGKADEGIELSSMGKTGSTTAVRRVPPPPPPR
ncbi:hypothetical protein JCM8547_008630 [Rhodosporidiobolus lusitaniae]